MPNDVEYLFLCVYGPSVYFGEVSGQIFCSFFIGCLWSPEFLKFIHILKISLHILKTSPLTNICIENILSRQILNLSTFKINSLYKPIRK